jgi:hypothetical protein
MPERPPKGAYRGIPFDRRVKLLGDGPAPEPKPAQPAPGIAGPAWEVRKGVLCHVMPCGGFIQDASTTLPRRFCRRCGREWHGQRGKDGKVSWEPVMAKPGPGR